jgi:hypothetical protein
MTTESQTENAPKLMIAAAGRSQTLDLVTPEK